MLPTCNRCRKRKTKCDGSLPGCRTCALAGLECVFYDNASHANVPRSYIAQLDERVRRLRGERNTLRDGLQHKVSGSQPSASRPSPSQLLSMYYDGSTSDPHRLCLVVNRSSNIFFGPGTAASVGAIVVKTATDAGLSGTPDMVAVAKQMSAPISLSQMDVAKLDRSIITLSTIRDLIETHYIPKIHPRYPIVELSDVELDTTRLSRLPTRRRFTVIMTAAIAAAFLGRNYPKMHTNALILRQWGDELANSILADVESPRLPEVLLLILYEIVDPCRGLIWSLLGLACRMCVKLGWHRNAGYIPPTGQGGDVSGDFQEQQRRTVLFIVLYELERRVCYILGRPTILPDISINVDLLPPLNELDTLRTLYTQSQLHQRIYEATVHPCPYSSEVVEIIQQQLDSSIECSPAWLMLYPILCHACDFCSSIDRRERDIEQAAITVIDHIFEQHRAKRILSIWLTTCEVFTAGAILVDINIRRKSQVDSLGTLASAKSFNRCSSLLASFAEIWPAGVTFKELFETLSEFLAEI